MFDLVVNLLRGCSHRRLTWPFTPVRKPGAPRGGTYVVCLDCGKELGYDWENMRVAKRAQRPAETATRADGIQPTADCI